MMKKIASFGLAVGFAVALMISVSVANLGYTAKAENVQTATATVTNANVITSGTFDNGKTGEELQANTDAWGVKTVVSGEEAYSGYSLKYTATGAESNPLFNYGEGNVMLGKIKAHTPYKLSYMIKVTGASNGFKVCPYFQPVRTSAGRLIFGTDDGSSTYKLDVSADTGWVSKTAYFVTGDDVSAPRIGFRYKGTGTIYLDEVTLVEDENYLVDGNMETSATWNGATISEEGGYFGKGIVYKSSASDSKVYYIDTSALVSGETYIATAKIKVSEIGSESNVSLRVVVGGTTLNGGLIKAKTNGWITTKVEFTAAQGTHRIGFWCNNVITAYMDEVKVVKKSNDTTVPSSEILSEGFEGDELNATLTEDKGNDVLTYGYGAYGKNAQIEHFATSGAKKYALEINQAISLKNGNRPYSKLSLAFKMNVSGNATIGARLVNGETVIAEAPVVGKYSCSSGWVDANVDFTVPENAPDTAKLQLVCDFGATDAMVNFDNAYIEGKITKTNCIKYVSISTDGTICINYYVEAVKNPESMTAEMGIEGGETESVIGVYDSSADLWKFSYGVAAKDYKKKVNISVTVGGETLSAAESIESYSSKVTDEKAKAVVDAMIEYCETARVFFAKETATAVGTDITSAIEKYKPTISGTDNDLSIEGATLVLESETTLNIYFNGNVSGKTITVDGIAVAPTLIEGMTDKYVISVKSIAAKDLGTAHTFAIGGYTVNISAFGYVYAVNGDESASAAYKNVVKALYAYGVAASNYFAA